MLKAYRVPVLKIIQKGHSFGIRPLCGVPNTKGPYNPVRLVHLSVRAQK